MLRRGLKHLRETNMSYMGHAAHSMRLAAALAVGSGRAVVHAIFPGMHVTSTTDLVQSLHQDLVQKRSPDAKQHK